MSVGKIATWVFLDSEGRALSKRGVVYNYETPGPQYSKQKKSIADNEKAFM